MSVASADLLKELTSPTYDLTQWYQRMKDIELSLPDFTQLKESFEHIDDNAICAIIDSIDCTEEYNEIYELYTVDEIEQLKDDGHGII